MTTADAQSLLRELVATPSVSGDESACAQRLRDYFLEHDREVWIDAVGNVRAPADDAVLLTSHIDTVPGTIPVRIEDEELWGRGSVDAKGSVAAMAIAAVETGVSFAAVVGEETDSRGAHHLLKDRSEPDAVINGEPSGWDAITVAYRGFLAGEYAVQTETTHSARTELNAIQQTVAWWNRIESVFDTAQDTPVVEQVSATPVAIDGGTTDDGFGVTGSLSAEFRIPLDQSIESIRSAVTDEIDVGAIDWGTGIPPVTTSLRTSLAGAFRTAIRTVGSTPRHLRKTGTSDMNVYATTWDCPMVTYGPGDSSFDHRPDERLALPEFEHSITVLTDVCNRLTQS